MKAPGSGGSEPDMVNHPPHYIGTNGIEAIDVIDGFNLTYNLGAAVAYLLRCQSKGDPVTDMRKAVWHISREVEQRLRAQQKSLPDERMFSKDLLRKTGEE
jgi:hypothetical protein